MCETTSGDLVAVEVAEECANVQPTNQRRPPYIAFGSGESSPLHLIVLAKKDANRFNGGSVPAVIASSYRRAVFTELTPAPNLRRYFGPYNQLTRATAVLVPAQHIYPLCSWVRSMTLIVVRKPTLYERVTQTFGFTNAQPLLQESVGSDLETAASIHYEVHGNDTQCPPPGAQ